MKTINDLKKELEIIDERIGQIMTSAQEKIDKLEIRAKKIEGNYPLTTSKNSAILILDT